MDQRIIVLRYIVARCRECVERPLKNSIRVLLDRKPYHDERLAFFRQYILHLIRLSPIRGVTCALNDAHEGPASQALQIINAIGFAALPECLGLRIYIAHSR